jgi:hypothetical protein
MHYVLILLTCTPLSKRFVSELMAWGLDLSAKATSRKLTPEKEGGDSY